MNSMKRIFRGYARAFFAFCALTMTSGAAFAQQEGRSEPWQMGMQQPGSPLMERLVGFHDMVLWIITAISLFVLALLIYVIVRFNAKANPEPSTTTHNTMLEVVWTIVPVIILVVIAIPSMRMLYYLDRTENPEMTLKVTGYQWYWGYEYPDHGGINFMSYIVRDDELQEGQPRLLTTDTQVVLPVDTNIQILVTAGDVLHAWAIPSLGLKVDAVPGRMNEIWVRIEKEGTYYGMCSELCGKDHGFMPIMVKAVSKEDFEKWVEEAKAEYSFNATGANDNEQQLAYAGVN